MGTWIFSVMVQICVETLSYQTRGKFDFGSGHIELIISHDLPLILE